MKSAFSICIVFFAGILSAQSLQSPSKNITLEFKLIEGNPSYTVNYKNKPVILESLMGVKLKETTDLASDLTVADVKNSTFNETWQPVLGEQSNIVNHYNEMKVALQQQKTSRKINIIFRVFDEGIAFRYDFPQQKDLNYFIVSDEVTQFNLTGDHKVFWIPGDYDSQEYVFNESKLSEIDNDKLNLNNGIALKTIGGRYVVQSPLMMKSKDNLYLNIFEAAVVNYPVMHLNVDVKTFKTSAQLVPNAIGDKAYLQTPCVSPWRTVMVSDDARDIVSSKMILNLNDPSRIDDTSWIKPMKYVGIWWEMHVGKSTWDFAGSQNAKMLPIRN